MEEQKIFFKILNELCEEKNISQSLLSFGWVRELKKQNKIHHIMNYQFDLNSANAYRIANDKYATYVILKENEIPMIEHNMLFSPFTRSEFFDNNFMEKVKKMLENHNHKIVIKANDSCQGKDVYCCTNELEAKEIIEKLFEERKDSVSICPYVEIDYEYRVVILDGQVLYVYKKKKPYVVGDGIHNVQQLIEQKFLKEINLSVSQDLDLTEIPEDGKEVIISWKHNLSNGAEPIVIENDENLEEIKNIAIRAAKTIGICFATIDISLTNENQFYIVEINGSVCMNKFAELVPNGYEIAKNIYAKAIDKMFEN